MALPAAVVLGLSESVQLPALDLGSGASPAYAFLPVAQLALPSAGGGSSTGAAVGGSLAVLHRVDPRPAADGGAEGEEARRGLLKVRGFQLSWHPLLLVHCLGSRQGREALGVCYIEPVCNMPPPPLAWARCSPGVTGLGGHQIPHIGWLACRLATPDPPAYPTLVGGSFAAAQGGRGAPGG